MTQSLEIALSIMVSKVSFCSLIKSELLKMTSQKMFTGGFS